MKITFVMQGDRFGWDARTGAWTGSDPEAVRKMALEFEIFKDLQDGYLPYPILEFAKRLELHATLEQLQVEGWPPPKLPRGAVY